MPMFGFIRKRFSRNMIAVSSTSSSSVEDENSAINVNVGGKEKEYKSYPVIPSLPKPSSVTAAHSFHEIFLQKAESVSFSYTVKNVPSFDKCVQQIHELGPMQTERIPIDFNKSTSKSCQGHTFSLTVDADAEDCGPMLVVTVDGDFKDHNKDVNEVLVLENLKLELEGSDGCVMVNKSENYSLLYSDGKFCKSFTLLWEGTVKSLTFTISGKIQYKHLKPKLVQAGLSTVSTTPALTTVSMPEFVIGMLQGLLFSGVHSDILISCDGEMFPAHRSILGAASPVFSVMMTADMKENQDNVIVMKETSASVCKELLRFIYTGSVDTTNWSMEFTQELYNNADMYDVPALKSICERKLTSLINVDNVGQLYAWTRIHELDKVRQAAKNFTMDNKTTVFKANDTKQSIEIFADIIDEIINHAH